jgi:hypothetical protein
MRMVDLSMGCRNERAGRTYKFLAVFFSSAYRELTRCPFGAFEMCGCPPLARRACCPAESAECTLRGRRESIVSTKSLGEEPTARCWAGFRAGQERLECTSPGRPHRASRATIEDCGTPRVNHSPCRIPHSCVTPDVVQAQFVMDFHPCAWLNSHR